MVLHFNEWMWDGAVPDEEMSGASLHLESPDINTPTRSNEDYKGQGHINRQVTADSIKFCHEDQIRHSVVTR